MVLYVLAGYPKTGLNAGGLQYCLETVENLAILEHDPMIQYTKEGVFAVNGSVGEYLGPVEYWLSPVLEREGIGWNWFAKTWGFGNGVTVHKTIANYETRTVDHNTGKTLDELLRAGIPIDLSTLKLVRVHKRTEGWQVYEKRWQAGMCPSETHAVHLTWFVTKHTLPRFAIARITDLIETPGVILRDLERYQSSHFSPERRWEPTASELANSTPELALR